MKHKFLLLIVGILFGVFADVYAADPTSVTIDGITYSCANGEAAVVNSDKHITTANIPESISLDGVDYTVTSIGEWVFYDSSFLATVTIPNSVSSIGKNAFYYCSSLTEVTIPKSVTFIGQNAFSSCNSLKKIFYNAENCMGSGFSLVWNGTGNTYWLYDTAIEEVIIGKTVKLIPQNAFNNCTSLTKVTIPNSVTTIGESAFNGSSSLTIVTIPNSVTSIGERAFYGCSGLTKVTISNSVTSIDRWTFSGCSSLNEITIPNSVTTIGNNAFSDCTGLTKVTIPNSVTNIDGMAFNSCSGLTEVTIPTSVTTIGDFAFSRSGLTEVTIPTSATSIGQSAFSNCKKLKKVYYNAEKCSGGGFSYSFQWLDGSLVKELVIGEAVQSIPDYAFYDCYINKIYYNAKNCINFGKEWRHLTPINEVVIGETVKSIPDNVFSGSRSLIKVTIPASVTSIGNSAFGGCGLTEVTIPASVTSIGNSAFGGCGLTEVTIPASVTSIGNNAFYNCSSLEKVTFLNSGALMIGDAAFGSCSILTEVNVPSIEQWLNISFHSSESNPTYYAKKLLISGENIRRLTIPDGIGHIDSFSLVNCEQLLTINMPASLESVGESAFEGCTGLQRIIFPSEKDFLELTYQSEKSRCTYGNSAKIYIDSEPFGPSDFKWPEDLTRIPDYAFYGVESLTSITIPNSVEYIGKYAFLCDNLKDIIIEDIISWSKIHFMNVAANPMCIARTFRIAGSEKPIEHLVLDMPGETVSEYAFCGANNLKTVRINASIVGKMTFYSCENLTDLCLNVDNIESYAFGNASNLKNIYLMTSTPPAASDDIFSKYDGVNLYVPVGAVSAYQNAENCWWRFLDVYESDFKDIDTIFKPDHNLSGVNGILAESSDFAVSTGDGYISFTAADGDHVSVYTLQGVRVHEGKGSVSLNLPPGVYIAKVGNSVKKVAVK